MSSISQRPWSFAMSARPLICDREYPEPSGLFGSIARRIFVAGGVGLRARAGGGGEGLGERSTSIGGAPGLPTSSVIRRDAGGGRRRPSPTFKGGPGAQD